MGTKKKRKTLNEYIGFIGKNVTVILIIAIFTIIIVGGALSINIKNTQSNEYGYQNNSQNNAVWQTFNSVEGDFKIDFPNHPKKEEYSNIVDGVKVDNTTYVSNDSDNGLYAVYVSLYDISPSNYDIKKLLEAMVNGVVQGVENANVTSSSFTTYERYQALEFTMKAPDRNMSYRGKVIIRDDLPTLKAYVLVSGAKTGTLTKHDQFVNSFAITD